MTIPLPVRSCIVTYLGEGRGLHYSLGVSAGERLIAQPIGTSLDLFTADQLRAYGEAVRAEERERMMPLIDEAILDAAGAALAGAGYDGDAIEKIAPRVLEMWRGFKSAAAIRAAAPPQCTAPPSELQ